MNLISVRRGQVTQTENSLVPNDSCTVCKAAATYGYLSFTCKFLSGMKSSPFVLGKVNWKLLFLNRGT